VDDASLVAREHVIASLRKRQTLLFAVLGYVVQVVGAKHALVELSGLPLEPIKHEACGGPPDGVRRRVAARTAKLNQAERFGVGLGDI
jgi:hypothetical protein